MLPAGLGAGRDRGVQRRRQGRASRPGGRRRRAPGAQRRRAHLADAGHDRQGRGGRRRPRRGRRPRRRAGGDEDGAAADGAPLRHGRRAWRPSSARPSPRAWCSARSSTPDPRPAVAANAHGREVAGQQEVGKKAAGSSVPTASGGTLGTHGSSRCCCSSWQWSSGACRLYRRHAVRQREGAQRAALESQLSTSRRAADEDVTKFGEELQRLDVDVAGHPLDEAMQQDYQRALDAYEDSKSSLDAVQQARRDPARHRDPRGRPLRRGLRQGPGQRASAAAEAAALLLQPGPRTLVAERRLGARRRRRPLGPGLPGRRRARPGRRRPVHPHRPGRRAARALLGGRPGVRALGAGLLRPLERQRHAVRHAHRQHALRRRRQHVRRHRRWASAGSARASATASSPSATASAACSTGSATSSAMILVALGRSPRVSVPASLRRSGALTRPSSSLARDAASPSAPPQLGGRASSRLQSSRRRRATRGASRSLPALARLPQS